MARSDYWGCAACDGKAFYDANIDWDYQVIGHADGTPRPFEDETGWHEHGLAVMALCRNCATTHELVCVKRAEPKRPPEGVEEK
jgi:hypothetical protein